MKITFFGAAQTVTGSMHLVEANGKRILLDCGLYQGHRKEAFERNRNMPVDPAEIDAVILSHAHIDHSGNLPQLVRRGFRGKVYARTATIDLVNVMLRDSCFLQMRDLEYVNKKRRAQGKHLFEPLYTEEDVDALIPLFEPLHLHQAREIFKGITLTFFNAGHILGSAQVMLDVAGGTGHNHRLLFSGDLGQPNQPILRHYEYPQGADIVFIESTYADRLHPSAEDVEGRLKGYIDDIIQQRSKLIIPAFSVGRTQQILYYLNRLLASGRIHQIPVYIDSPLSQKATKIYEKHTGCYNDEAMRLLNSGVNPLTFPGMQFVETPQQSMSLNELRGPMVIVAASGMCEGGRVVHHLKASAHRGIPGGGHARPPSRGAQGRHGEDARRRGEARGARPHDQRPLGACGQGRTHGLVRRREGPREARVRRARRAGQGEGHGRPPGGTWLSAPRGARRGAELHI